MKNLKNYKMKALFFSLCILTGIVFPILFSVLDISSYNMSSIDDSDNAFIYSLNGKDYLAKYITAEDVEEMKKGIDTQPQSSRHESNIIIDGHGTGYNINPEDLESLVGKVSLLEVIPESGQKYRATADLSTEIYFPTVGDQGSQGSCSAWANAYYAYGYLEAKDYGWDASSGNPDYLLSPAWAYNIIAAYDYGSIPYEVVQVLLDWGVPTLSAMPYDDSDVDSWGNETAWRQAPYHRPFNYTLITYTGPATINLMKSLITAGTPVTIGIDAYQFSNGLDEGTMDFILSSGEYDSDSLNHAQCLVGYDDAVTEGSDVGAFRVVNSWGDTWMDNGYYWLTYDAFAEFAGIGGQVIMYIVDRIDYNPDLIATWEFSPAPTRMQYIVTLGVGPYSSPLDTLTPFYDYDINNLFPDFMTLDISDFYSYYTIDNDVFFFLEIGPSDTTGTISSFKLERYLGGVLQEISKESLNVPEDTPGYVNATFKIFLHELRVMLDVPTNPIIYDSYQITAMVINNGASGETAVDFELLLNGLSVDSMIIPSLLSGANATINYNWMPTEYEVFNFTAQAPPVSGENYTLNNVATEILSVLGPIFHDDFESGLSKWVSITGLWHLTDTSSIWPDPYNSPIHSMWFGNESTGTYETGYREFGNITSIPINLTLVDTAFLEFYHWREGEGYGYDVSFVYITIDGINWDLIYETDDSYILPWEKVSVDISSYVGNPSVQLRFTFDTFDSIMNDYRGWLVDDVAVMGTGMQIPHNLRVSLEVPEDPEIFNTYTINATVTNIGTSGESDVYFFLYLNGVEVYSQYFPSFPIHSSQGFSYIWTPTAYGEYNFTAYAPPVPGEEFTYDNLVTEVLHLREIILFDGMFLNYSFEIFGDIYSWNSLYSDLSEGIFHNDYSIYLGGSLTDAGYWDVDSRTRIMSDSAGDFAFGSGTHTPLWIFTGLSIGDMIPIAVDAEGDHMFNITGDFLYDLPGFGTVDVWILEDLTLLGGIAWYEKSTGILLYGFFPYYGGMYNYTVNLVYTNAELNILEPPDPFTLTSNAEDPDDDGLFDLTWTASSRADNYTVYRGSSFITVIDGSLTLLADEITDLNLALSGYSDGTYYFIVVAHNEYGDTLSNCIEVTVGSLPGDFTLSSNAGNPDGDGIFDLTWTASSDATNYSVYRGFSFITVIDGSLTLLADEITDLTLALSGYLDGTYYFIVVAHNEYGDTLSNCISVTVLIKEIPGYNLILIIATLGIVSTLLIRKKYSPK